MAASYRTGVLSRTLSCIRLRPSGATSPALPASKQILTSVRSAITLFAGFWIASACSVAPPPNVVPKAPVRSCSLRVVTLNTAKETRAAEIIRQLRAARRVRDADVFLLQEVAHASGHPGSVADEIAAELMMNVVYAPAAPGVADQGLAVLSRYPLRDASIVPLCRYDLLWHSRARFALSVTASTPAGDIRISNAHLDTRVNAADRVRQLEDALKDDRPGTARIVAGDFNTNNFYWLFHALPLPVPQVQTAVVRHQMEKRGFVSALRGSAATFDYLGMQLDWVFSRGLRVRESEVVPIPFSDHHALWAELTAGTGR